MKTAIALLIFSLTAFSGAAIAQPNTTAASAQSPMPSSSNPSLSNSKPAAGRVLTRAVGEAGDRIVTSREVRINDVVDQVFAKFAPVPPVDSPEVSPDRAKIAPAERPVGKKVVVSVLRGDEKNFASRVTDVLVEWIIYLEAKSFSSEAASKADANEWLRKVESEMADDLIWPALEVSSSELKEMIERKLIAKSFLRLKTDSSLVPVTDAEAQAYYKKNRVKFGNMPFNSFKENIKSFLKQQQTERRLKDWLEVLQRRYKVRNFIAA